MALRLINDGKITEPIARVFGIESDGAACTVVYRSAGGRLGADGDGARPRGGTESVSRGDRQERVARDERQHRLKALIFFHNS